MDRNEPTERPPPYYSIMAPPEVPPGAPRGGIGVGAGYGVNLPITPHHTSQKEPAPGINQQTLPSGRRRQCCEKCSPWLAGFAVFLLALLAIAVWLGVCYGARLGMAEGHGGHDGEDGDDDDGEEGSGQGKQWSMKAPGCFNASLPDCQQDNHQSCARFSKGDLLQVRTAQDASFLPVCFEGWNQRHADLTCAQLGFRKSFRSMPVPSDPSSALMPRDRGAQHIPGLVSVSFCPGRSTVALQCVDCGRTPSPSRIIGGSAAQVGQWPWQVSLHFRDSHVCGGTVVSPDFVLTAAHCFPSSTPSAKDPSRWRVYAGAISQSHLGEPRLVERIVLNQNYDVNTDDQDVALLRLRRPLEFSVSVQPVCLPAFDQSFPQGTSCWTSGFGTTVEGADHGSSDLRGVSVDIVEPRVCNSSRMYGGQVSQNMLCAGHLGGGKDSCQGDSGGPLVCQGRDGRWVLAGITSWGSGCGRRDRPGVYSSTTSLLPWIYRQTQEHRPTGCANEPD